MAGSPASPRPDDRGDGMTGDAARGFDHFKNRVTAAVAQIVAHKRPVNQSSQRQHVRRRQVFDVDVVPDAGAVGGGIIIAENCNVLPLAERHLQDQRDQVCFRAMRLAATG